ncbi:MAG: hypothetical protein WC408_00145 [Candidatus Micrarchaeia archaeon]
MQNQPVNFSKNFCDDILVLDTTLRDGDQAPGTHLTPEKKLWLARKLDEAGVDVIEAGNAAVSAGEKQALKAIASAHLNAQVLSFARVVPADIDAAAQCGVDGVHLVFPSSALHIEQKLRKTADEALGLIVDCVRQAKSLGLVVELSAEDGSRAQPEFLKKVFLAGAQAGAVGPCKKPLRVCPCLQQAACWRERLLPRVRHPRRRPSEGHGHLRGNFANFGWPQAQDTPRQAFRPQGSCAQARRVRLCLRPCCA